MIIMVFVVMIVTVIAAAHLQNNLPVWSGVVIMAMMMAHGGHDNDFGPPVFVTVIIVGHRQFATG
jgi:uncharacterized membrane protein YkvI